MSWKSWLRALGTPSKQTPVNRRRLELEPLEDRVVPTAYVFVDFGDNFSIVGNSRVLTTTVGAIRDVAPDLRAGDNSRIPNTVIPGPQLTNAADVNYPDSTSVMLTQFDNTADARAVMMAETRRAFASLDVTVVELTRTAQFLPDGRVVAAAANMAGVGTTLRGNFTNTKDVYVIVAQPAIGPSNDNPNGFASNGYGGIAPTGIIPLGIDLPEFTDLQGGFNRHDDLVLNFRNDAETIVHEAGHALGLRHSVTTAAPATSAINNAIHTSEVMSYLSGNTSYFFSRFPMVHGDDNTNPAPPPIPGMPPGIPPLNNNDLAARGMLTPFDQLRIDANVGENPNLHYISGTGAHDLITVSRGFGNTAVVSVRAFTDNTYSSAIIVPGTNVTEYSYTFSLDRRILIQAGLGDDQITIDSGLNVPIDLDGMGGRDLILLAADANFVLANYRLDISNRPSINLENMEYAILSGGNGDNTFDLTNWTGTADLQGFGGRNTVVSSSDRNFILSDAVLHKVSFVLEPIISINLSNIQNAVLTGRSTGIFPTSGNNSFDVSGWTGTATIDGAGGTRDLIRSSNDANFILTNFLLTRSNGGAFVLLNIESAHLTGGASSNTFDVGGWTPIDNGANGGQVVLDGQGGFNTLVVANDVDFELTDSLLRRSRSSVTYARIEFSRINHAVLTGGNSANLFTLVNWRNQATLNGNGGADRLILDDRTNFATIVYSVTATRIDDRINPASGGIAYFNMPNLVINGGLTTNVFLIEGTAAGSTTTINAGPGLSQVVVTPAFHSLQQLQGTLNVNGSGATTLYLDDRNTVAQANIYTFSNEQLLLTRFQNGPPTYTQIHYKNLAGLTLRNAVSTGQNVLSVVNTGGTNELILDTNGSNAQVLVGDTNTGLDAIGKLNVLGGAGTVLTLDDSATANYFIGTTYFVDPDVAYQVTAGMITRTNVVTTTIIPTNTRSTTTYSNSITYSDLAALFLVGGSSANAFDLLSTASAGVVTINTGNGDDIVRIGSSLDVIGNVTIKGNAGINTLRITDTDGTGLPTTLPPDTTIVQRSLSYTVTSQSIGRAASYSFVTPTGGGASSSYREIAYEGITALELNGSNIGANYSFAGAASPTPAIINGGSGDDVITLGPNLDSIGRLSVNGNAGVNTLKITDTLGTGVPTNLPPASTVVQRNLSYQITAQSVTRTGAYGYVTPQGGGAGVSFVEIAYQGIAALELNGSDIGAGIRIASTTGATTVRGGSGKDDIFLGSAQNTLDPILYKVVVDGQGSGDRVVVQDDLSLTPHTYTVTSNSISRDGFAIAEYSNVEALQVNAGRGNDTVNVVSTHANTATEVDSGRGNDRFQIGDNGKLSSIKGSLHLRSASTLSGVDLFLDDSNELASKTNVVMNDGSVTGLAPATISWTASATGDGGITGVYVLGGRGGNRFTVENTSPLYHYTFLVPGAGANQVDVRGTQGALLINSVFGAVETVTISSLAPALGGSLARIHGEIYLQGSGSATLLVDDRASTSDHTSTVTESGVVNLAPVPLHWLPSVTKAVTLNWGSGLDTIFMESTAAGVMTTLNGGDGNDAFIHWSLDAIRGPLALHGEGGVYDYPIFSDQANPVGQAYTFTSDRIRRAGKADITFDSMIQVILYTSPTGVDTVNVESVAPGVFTPIVLGVGDTLTLGRPVVGENGRTLQDILGTVRPQIYGNGAVSVIVDDSADTDSRDATFAFDATPSYNITLTGLAPAPIASPMVIARPL